MAFCSSLVIYEELQILVFFFLNPLSCSPSSLLMIEAAPPTPMIIFSYQLASCQRIQWLCVMLPDAGLQMDLAIMTEALSLFLSLTSLHWGNFSLFLISKCQNVHLMASRGLYAQMYFVSKCCTLSVMGNSHGEVTFPLGIQKSLYLSYFLTLALNCYSIKMLYFS